MLVQKRSEDSNTEDLISLRVSTVSQLSYEISIDANSTFGNYISIHLYYIVYKIL